MLWEAADLGKQVTPYCSPAGAKLSAAKEVPELRNASVSPAQDTEEEEDGQELVRDSYRWSSASKVGGIEVSGRSVGGGA